jgi:probable phosphoglycerate mutase
VTPKTLVLVRHGQTAWNLERRAQGHADIPLDDVGHAQALEVATRLVRLEPQALWSSDLRRAMQTADHISQATGLGIHADPRLREYDVGARQGLTGSEFAEAFPDEAATHRGFSTEGVPGAESADDVVARMVPALGDCFAALEPGQTGVVVSHGGSVRAALAAVLGWSVDHRESLRPLPNCAWAVLEQSSDAGHVRLAHYGLPPA